MISACERSTACLASWNGASGRVRICAGGWRSTCLDGAAPASHLVATIGADLEACKPRPVARQRNIGREFSLKHLPREEQLSALEFAAHRVAHQQRTQRSCELGRKVAYLVGMRKQHQLRLVGSMNVFSAATKPSGV